MIKKQKKNQYKYTDISMVCGIVSMEPGIKSGPSGKNYVEFPLGQRFGEKENTKWKNYKARVFDQEIGNEILALVKKNDSIMVLGHVDAYVYHTKTGESGAGLCINVTEWKKAPDARDVKQVREKLRSSAVVEEDEDETEEPEDANEEILF